MLRQSIPDRPRSHSDPKRSTLKWADLDAIVAEMEAETPAERHAARRAMYIKDFSRDILGPYTPTTETG